MMYIDYEANTEKEAIQLALDSLGLSENDVRIEILEKEKRGLFGIGKKEKAKVRIYYKERSEVASVVNVLKELIERLDASAQVDFLSLEGGRYSLRIETETPSHLIGKQGRNLKAIQTVVNAIVSNSETNTTIRVDVDNYFNKRYETLIKKSVYAARQVLRTKKHVMLEPMNSYERRLVHTEISRQVPGVNTESEGSGTIKQIKIRPS